MKTADVIVCARLGELEFVSVGGHEIAGAKFRVGVGALGCRRGEGERESKWGLVSYHMVDDKP